MKLENACYRIEVDPGRGAVCSLLDKAERIELIAEPRLAESFRLLVPLPDLEANYILGTEQKVSSVEETAGGARLRWDGPLTNARGEFALAVTVGIELVNQAVQFRIAATGGSPWNALLGSCRAPKRVDGRVGRQKWTS